MWPFLCLVVVTLWLAYYLWSKKYSYWKDRGFPYLTPTFPYGNVKGIAFFTEFQGYVHQDIYNRSPHPFVGIFTWRVHNLLIRDPELLKRILVKDFNFFRDRVRVNRGEELSNHLFNLPGHKWRPIRVKLTPTFTSGKLKTMFTHFQQCAKNLDGYILEKVKGNVDVDVKNMMYRFTCEVIASAVFGLDIDMFSDEQQNEFSTLGKVVFPPNTPLGTKIKTALNAIFPQLESVFQFSAFPSFVIDFVMKVITDTVEYREKNGVKRNDFLDLLIELKNKTLISNKDSDTSGCKEEAAEDVEMTITVMAAQCFIFLVAGFETSSSVQSYCLYELALNPDIQDKLRREINEMLVKDGGLTYQVIQEMKYLDQVISETLRKYPTLPFLNRICTKNYKIPDSGLIVEEGTKLIIPTYALHHDPKYFPEPERFDPDRFSPERKKDIRPFTYLPFGEGPRACIGERFGLLQTKMGLCTILRNYNVTVSKETEIPLKFSSTTLITSTEGPIMLKVESL